MIKYIFGILLLFSLPCFGATYYVCDDGTACNAGDGDGWSTGNDSNNTTQAQDKATPWKTITHGIATMSGGDTLIVGDGAYPLQRITAVPAGNYGTDTTNGTDDDVYTIIKSENIGGAVIDMDGSSAFTDDAVRISTNYVQVEGFLCKGDRNRMGDTDSNGSVIAVYGNYVKIIRMSSSVAPKDNSVNFSVGSQDTTTNHVLFEENWAWGEGGRYKFLAYRASEVIFRRNVARFDYADYVSYRGWINQEACFVNYDSNNIVMQNNIAIDSGDTASSYNTDEGDPPKIYGAIWDEKHTSEGDREKNAVYQGNIILNIDTNYAMHLDRSASTRVFENNVMWGSDGGGYVVMPDASETTSYHPNVDISNYTVGNINSNISPDYFDGVGHGFSGTSYRTDGTWDIINSIVYDASEYGIWYSTMSSTYTVLYGNAENYGGGASGGTGNVTDHDPLVSGLKYLVKIEDGSYLKTAGSGGGQVGATVLYQYGVSGTQYGQTGYDTLTAIKLWPFPNEDKIRSDFRTYNGNGPSGTRGFAASGVTLTSYIGNYLGNNDIGTTGTTSAVTVTADVDEHYYGESGETDTVDPVCAISDSKPKTLSSGYTTTLGFTSSDANGIDECKWNPNSAPDETHGTLCTGTTSGTCSVTGLVMGDNTIYVGCADPSNNWGSDSITVNAPPYRASAGGSYSVY